MASFDVDLRPDDFFAGAFLAGVRFAGVRLAPELRADEKDPAETAGVDGDDV